MFNSTKVVAAYSNLIGWKQHYDVAEINLPLSLTDSDTKEYYQQKHAALRLDLIQALIPENYDLEVYLRETITDATNEIFNDLINDRQVGSYGKTLLDQSVLLDRYGWINDKITNMNRFVGFQIKVKSVTALKTMINEIGLQLDNAQTLTLTLFHSQKTEPLTTIDLTTIGDGNWTWKISDLELNAFSSELFQGGVFIIGYYQEDLIGNAINYSNFDWNKGFCGSCGSTHSHVWRSIKKHFHIYPIYVPEGSFVKDEMFDLNSAIYTHDQSWGLNMKMSVHCDLTDFFIQNRTSFKTLLQWKVVNKILEMMKFSQQINNIEKNIKMMIIRDLEGDIDTKLTNIPTRYSRELRSVKFNTGGINSDCLGCESDGYAPQWGQV